MHTTRFVRLRFIIKLLKVLHFAPVGYLLFLSDTCVYEPSHMNADFSGMFLSSFPPFLISSPFTAVLFHTSCGGTASGLWRSASYILHPVRYFTLCVLCQIHHVLPGGLTPETLLHFDIFLQARFRHFSDMYVRFHVLFPTVETLSQV